MSERKIRQLFTGFAVLLLGITLVELVIAYAVEYTAFEIVLYGLIGAAAAVFAAIFFLRPGLSVKEHEMDFIDTAFPAKPVLGDAARTAELMEQYREDHAGFYAEPVIRENAPIQYDVTQFYKNILDLHRKRLQKLGVELTFRSERRAYSGQPIRIHSYFDGKYQIREVQEEIEAFRRYSVGDRTLLVRRDAEAAHYTMLHAKQTEGDRIICPACGNATTRENLIDGCDYCGTRFTVEDLGEKISDFALRSNYEIAYTKYKQQRSLFAKRTALLAFSVFYVLCSLVMTMLAFDETTSGAGRTDPVNPLFLLWGSFAVLGVAAVFLTALFMLLYMTTILPAMEIRAKMAYTSGQKLQQLQNSQKKAVNQEKKIRRFDPLFSMNGFYSNVQNKLSLLLYSDRAGSPYGAVIDYDIEDMQMTDYQIRDGLQQARVTADLTLYELDGTKIRERKEQLKLRFVKAEACKTQAVCAPYVMRCRSCGSSLSSANGYVCNYCGTKLDLKQYDWELL